MAKLDLTIRTAADLKGVQQLKTQLKELNRLASDVEGPLSGSFSSTEIQKTINAVRTLDTALDSAFDVNLGSININKFNDTLKKSNMSVNSLYRDLSRLGVEGQKAFVSMTNATLTMGKSIKKTNVVIENMKTTLKNTVTWGISSSMFNNLTSSVQKAFSFVKGLDKDLNDIRIVTGKSADQMERFAREANRAAKDLAVSTRDYTQGALIYYQQGLSDEEVAARTNVTAKAANVTGQDMSTVSEQLTAVWNGYQVANEAAKEGMQVYELYVDKISAVGAKTASNLEEQATAMSKVASAAASMGVGFDQLNAQIATIVSVTRQAPESVGTALKTIYARLGDLQVNGVDEFGTKLGEVSSQLQVMGINVVDSNGEMREMGQVMTEVAEKWDTWTSAQKQAAAVAMAGKRQYNNLIALFDNWDMYGESLATSMNAAGTLTEQQNVAVDSLEKKMEKLTTTAEKFYDALFDESSIGGLVDGLTTLVDFVGSLTQGLGGLKTILPIVAGLLIKTFSKDIGKGIAGGLFNMKTGQAEAMNDVAKLKMADELGDKGAFLRQAVLDEKEGKTEENSPALREANKLAEKYKELMKYKKDMTEEEIEQADALLNEQAAVSQMALDYEDMAQKDAMRQRKQKEVEDKKITKDSIEKQKNTLTKVQDIKIKPEQKKSFNDIIEESGKKFNKNEDINKIINRDDFKNAKNDTERLNIVKEQLKNKKGKLSSADAKIIKDLEQKLKELNKTSEQVWDDIKQQNTEVFEQMKDDPETIEKLKQKFIELKDAQENADKSDEQILQQVQESLQQETQKDEQTLNQANDMKVLGTRAATQLHTAETFLGENINAPVSSEGLINSIAGDMSEEQLQALQDEISEIGDTEEKIERLKEQIESLNDGTKETEDLIKALRESFNDLDRSGEDAWNAIREANKDAFKDIEGDEETIQRIHDRFIELRDTGISSAAALTQASEELREEAQATLEVQRTNQEIDIRQREVDEAQSSFVEQLDTEAVMSSLSSAAGGVATSFAGVMGIVNSFNTMLDTSLSSSERFKAAWMGFGASIPMLVTGVNTVVTAISGLTTATNTNTLADAANTLAKEANAKMNQFLTNTALGKRIATALGIPVTNADTVAETANAAATEARGWAQVWATVTAGPLAAITLVLVAAIIALVAIVATVTALINNYTEKLEKNTESAEKNLEKQKEATEVAREHKAAIEEVTTAYEELAKQYDNGELSLEELKSKTYDLCMQYDLEDLAIKALTSDYQTLNEVMKEAQEQADENLSNSLKREASARSNYLAANVASTKVKDNQTRIDDNGKTIDIDDAGDYIGKGAADFFTGRWIPGLFGASTFSGEEKKENEKLQKTLENFGVKVEDGHIDTQEFLEAAAKDYDGLLEALQASNADEVPFLIEILTENQDAIKENTEALKEAAQLDKQKIVREKTEKQGDINSVADYSKVITNIEEDLRAKKDELYAGMSDEEIEEQIKKDARNILNKQNEDINKIGQQFAIIEELQSKAGSTTGQFDMNTLAAQLEDMTNAQRQFIQENLDFAVINSDKSLKEIVEQYSDYIDYMNSKNFEVELKMVLEDKEITQEEIDEIYDNYGEDFEKRTGLGKEEFAVLDYSEAATVMTQYYIDTRRQSLETKEQIIKDAEAVRKAQEEIYEQSKANIEDEKENAIQNLSWEESKVLAFNKKDTLTAFNYLKQLKESMSDEGYQNFIASTDNKLYSLIEKSGIDSIKELNEQTDAVLKANKAINDYTDDMQNASIQIDYYNKIINDSAEASVNYAETLPQIKQNLESTGEAIERLQSGYTDLFDIVNEYDQQGFLSLESLQKLVSMDGDMLAALEWDETNKTMSLNTDLMKQNLITKLQSTKQTIIQEGQLKLLALQEKDTALQTYLASISFQTMGQSLEESTKAVKQATLDWDALNKELSGKAGYETQLIIDETNKKLQNVDKTIEAINENPISMITGDIFDKDDLKLWEEEFDRYWEINHILEEIEETMSDLERIQKKLHGKELIASLKQENKLLEEQSKAYERLRAEQITEADELREKLSHMGVSFYSEDGSIANYKAATENALARYNSIISSSNVTEESKEQAEKDYEHFKEWLERYDELITEEIKDTENKIEEVRLNILDNNLEAWETELEIKLDTTQAERDWNEFLNDITTDFTQHFEDIGKTFNLAKDNFNTYIREDGDFGVNEQAVEDVIAEMKKLEAGEESTQFATMSEAKEKLKELWEQTRDSATDAKDAYQDMWEAYLDGIDQAQDKFDEFIEQYDTINEHLETEKELIELIYGEEAYDRIGNVLRAENEATAAQMRSQKERVDQLYGLMMQEEEGSEARQKYYEQWIEAQSELNNLTTEYVDELKNIYSNEIKKILKDFETAVTKGSSFDDLAEEWERVQKKSDKYFDNVEKIYEVQKLSNTIQGSIDSATDIKNQQKLQDLHDREIEYLRDKEKLTQYDLDAANARYEIALKEIALEEAQNSKNAMKLTRGADGNWSYQYVADGDEIAAKQQELSDAYNNLYQLADSAHKENINEALDLLSWYTEQADKIANDQELSDEQRKAKLLELEQQFKESLNNLTLESETYRRDQAVSTGLILKDSYEQDIDNYNIMTDVEKDLCNKMKEVVIGNYDEIWDKTSELYQYIENDANNALLGNAETWDSLGQQVLNYWAQDGGQSISKHIEDSINSIMLAYDSYQTKVDEGLFKTGRDVRSLGADYDDLTTSINGVETAISNLISQTTPELQGYSDTIRKMKKPFEDLKLEVQNVQIEVEKALKMLGSFNPDDYDFDINKGNKSEYDNVGQNGGDPLGGNSPGDAQSLRAEDFNIYNEGGYRQYDVKGDMKYAKDDKGHEIKTTRNGQTLYEVSVDGTKFYTDKKKYEGQAKITTSQADDIEEVSQSPTYFKAKTMPDINRISIIGYSTNLDAGFPVKIKSTIPGTEDIGWISFDYAEDLKLFAPGKTIKENIEKKEDIINKLQTQSPSQYFSNAASMSGITKLATGGYTGAWGSEGKMAILHEKELILNKTDTENILNTVSMVRSLEQGLLGKIAGMLADLSNLGNNGYISNSTKNNSQSNNNVFNITAEFPNANDVTSIKEAILSLPNIVSQHIAERKR